MIPALYLNTQNLISEFGHPTTFLSETVECFVEEERNGPIELVLRYPARGYAARYLKVDNIIASDTGNLAYQLFRIYSVSVDIDGIIEVKAEHISYWLNYIHRMWTRAKNIGELFNQFKDFDPSSSPAENPLWHWGHTSEECPFQFLSTYDLTAGPGITIDEPASIRQILGGMSGSLIDVYGGELEFDNFTVFHKKERGTDKGITIRYGVDLTEFERTESDEEVITGVIPYYIDSATGQTYLSKNFVYRSAAALERFAFPRTRLLDLSGVIEFDERTYEMMFAEEAGKILNNPEHSSVTVNTDIGFIDLSAYNNISHDELHICDTVRIDCQRFGGDIIKAKIVKTKYNVLQGKFESLEVGTLKSTLSSTLGKIQNEVIDGRFGDLQQGITDTNSAIRRVETRMDTAEQGLIYLNGQITGYHTLQFSDDGLDLWTRKLIGFSANEKPIYEAYGQVVRSSAIDSSYYNGKAYYHNYGNIPFPWADIGKCRFGSVNVYGPTNLTAVQFYGLTPSSLSWYHWAPDRVNSSAYTFNVHLVYEAT